MRRAHVPNTTLSIAELLRALVQPADVSSAERAIVALIPEGGEPILFASARGALTASFEALAPSGAVAVPAYTCTAVANAVFSAGCQIAFVDVGSGGLVAPDAWPEADAVVVQNTYGARAPIPSRPIVILDSAHRADLAWKTEATISVTSFEHSKWLSSGQGGLAFTRDPELASRLREIRDRTVAPAGHIEHVLVTLLTMVLGRLEYTGRDRPAHHLRRGLQRIASDRLRGQTLGELRGEGINVALRGRPNRGAARLILSQVAQAGHVAQHRAHIVGIYDSDAGIARAPEPLVRYPMTVDDPRRLEESLRAEGWNISGRWFAAPLHPATADPAVFSYTLGLAPSGEALSASVVNLPTHMLVTEIEAKQLIALSLAHGATPLLF